MLASASVVDYTIEGEFPYVYLDGVVLKRSWAGEVRNVSLLVASAVNSEGFREILGICEGAKEDKSGWSAFLRHLVDRGLRGVQLIISDACRGLMESAAEFLPEAFHLCFNIICFYFERYLPFLPKQRDYRGTIGFVQEFILQPFHCFIRYHRFYPHPESIFFFIVKK